MSFKDKILVSELTTTLTRNELSEMEVDNDELSKPDFQLQLLISNYRKAAEELSNYLGYSKDEAASKNTFYKDSVQELEKVSNPKQEKKSILTNLVKKIFAETYR